MLPEGPRLGYGSKGDAGSEDKAQGIDTHVRERLAEAVR